jgi:hypothetical protein
MLAKNKISDLLSRFNHIELTQDITMEAVNPKQFLKKKLCMDKLPSLLYFDYELEDMIQYISAFNAFENKDASEVNLFVTHNRRDFIDVLKHKSILITEPFEYDFYLSVSKVLENIHKKDIAFSIDIQSCVDHFITEDMIENVRKFVITINGLKKYVNINSILLKSKKPNSLDMDIYYNRIHPEILEDWRKFFRSPFLNDLSYANHKKDFQEIGLAKQELIEKVYYDLVGAMEITFIDINQKPISSNSK